MTETELQQVVDALAAKTAADAKAAAEAKKDAFKDKFAKARAWVTTHGVALAVGGAIVFAILKV